MNLLISFVLFAELLHRLVERFARARAVLQLLVAIRDLIA